MKKNGIRILVGVMLVALLGLLGIQWYWVNNAVALKEEQFERKVNHALHNVAEHLQDQESFHFLDHDLKSRVNIYPGTWDFVGERDSTYHRRNIKVRKEIEHLHDSMTNGKVEVVVMAHTGKDSIRKEHIISEDLKAEWKQGRSFTATGTQAFVFANSDEEVLVLDSDSDTAKGHFQYTMTVGDGEKYIKTVLHRMLRSDHPIEERINDKLLDSLIRTEIAAQHIEEPYHYEIIDGTPKVHVAADNAWTSIAKPEGFSVHLFPHDLVPSHHYLRLDFPERQSATVQAMGLLLPTSGVLVLVVVLCFGLTLLALQRQKKVSELKTDFINNMTHELKTPISTISLAVQALSDPDMQQAANINQYADVIRQENSRLQAHVERVLQAAAFERGALNLQCETVDAQSIVAREVERIRPLVESRGGRIEVENAAESGLMEADPVHFAGIIFNLLDNANKYSPEAPEIRVRRTVSAKAVHIVVSDKGIGMKREALKRVFDKFYRVPTGNVHDVKGFGLGLSYVKTMVEAHGGTIQVRSEAGQGSRFELTFPRLSPAAVS